MAGQALARELVHDRQHLEPAPAQASVMHEVVCPDVVRTQGPAGDEPEAAPLALSPLRAGQLHPIPQVPDPLVVDVPAAAPQERPGAAVAEAGVFLRDPTQLLAQGRFGGAPVSF